jgi:hypothetical protein
LGRQHARRRDDQLHTAKRLSKCERRTLRLIEHLTPKAPRLLEWSLTVEDSATWTRPWTFAIPLTANDAERIEQYECHEGNHAVFNILSAARAAEREAAGATAR